MNRLPIRLLGPEKLEVTVICLGGWPLGGGMGPIEEKQAIRVVHAALDEGVNFIDTAEGYRDSESIIGKALVGRRHAVVLATKLSGDHSPAHIKAALENSLRQLKTDYVDLYQLHRPSDKWPISDTMDALSKLKDAGKIRNIGVSNFTVRQLEDAVRYRPVASVQPQYSMIFRQAERYLFPYCVEHNIGVITYAPIARGLLTGKYKSNHAFSKGDDRATHPSLTMKVRETAASICNHLAPWAHDHGYTMAQLAIAWILANRAVTSTICGAKTPEQIIENCKASRWRLNEADKREIDRHLAELLPID